MLKFDANGCVKMRARNNAYGTQSAPWSFFTTIKRISNQELSLSGNNLKPLIVIALMNANQEKAL